MQRLNSPYPLFIDGRGALLDAGFIYVGIADGDPETDPINLFLDQALTVPIAQPLRTLGGLIIDGANAVYIYFAEADASVRVRDADGYLVSYTPRIAVASIAYQPLDTDLTAIAALTTTAYGRALLALANQTALQAAVGLPPALAATGGNVSGNIVRTGAGAYFYAADAAMTGCRVFFTVNGAADPTGQPGDIWLEAEE